MTIDSTAEPLSQRASSSTLWGVNKGVALVR